MRTTREIGSSNMEMMELILDFVMNFNVNRLLFAINGKKLDEESIISIKINISEQNARLNRQKQHLFNFGRSYNDSFSSDDDGYVDTTLKVARKIRSGTKCVKDIIKRFCRIKRRDRYPNQAPVQAINVSTISTPNYVVDLFGISSYPQCVADLFVEMFVFYGNLQDCIEEAIRILKEEKCLKKDIQALLELLEKALAKSRADQAFLIEAVENDEKLRESLLNNPQLSSDKENPVLKAWKEYDKESFAKNYFHNCSQEDISKISLYEYLQDTGNPEIDTCMTIFGCNKTKAQYIIDAISTFDTFLPSECKRDKIPAIYLYVFMKWCSTNIGYESFLTYFNKRYKPHGKWDTIKKSAMGGAAKLAVNEDSKYLKVETELLKKLNEIFPEESVQQSA